MKKILLILISLIFLASNAFAANEWRAGATTQTIPGTTLINDIDIASFQNIVDPLDRTLSTFNTIGLVYSSVSAITASNGSVVCSDSGGTIRKMRLNPSTTSVSFTDIDTGAEASATTYYVWANCDADATTATFKVSASSSAPSGVTYYAKIGSFYNDGSSNILMGKVYSRSYGYSVTDSNGASFGQLGDWVSKSFETSYQATTDGFFQGNCDNTGSASTGITIYSDSSSSPSTVRCKSAIGANTGGTLFCNSSVKKGDYYKIAQLNGCTANQSAYFIPMGY